LVTKANPYVVDRPLAENDFFCDRRDALEWIEDRLRAGVTELIVFGPRRIGKTSLINHLPLALFDLYAPVAVTLAPREGENSQTLLGRIVGQIVERVRVRWDVSPENQESPEDASIGQKVEALGALGEAMGDRRLLICCDDLDRERLADPIVSEAIGSLRGQTGESIRLLFAVDCRSGDEPSVNALDGIPGYELGNLSEASAEDLLISPALHRLAYDYDAVRQVYRLASGHPYFSQLFGYLLFAQRETAGWVSIYDVLAVAGRVVELGQEEFQHLWNQRDPDAKIVLAAFGALKGRQGVATVNDLSEALRLERIHVPEAEIEQAAENLVAVGVLQRLGTTSYRFKMGLFWLWLRDNKPVTQVVRELRRYSRGAVGRLRIKQRRQINWGMALLWAAMAGLVFIISSTWRSREQARLLDPGPGETPTATGIVVASPVPTSTPTKSLAPMRTHIAYMAKENPADTWEIWTMRSDGSDPRRLTSSDSNDTVPSWSPDGRRILFESDRDGNGEVYVMNSDGNDQINLTAHPAEDGTPSWSPDGSMVVFASYRDDNWEIYLMDDDGANPLRLTYDDSSDYAPVWSPDGSRIAFVSKRDGNWEIYVMNADGTESQRLTYEDATDFAPAWSPDGRLIAFESYRDGDMEVYVMAADGSDQLNVTQFPGGSDHGPTWAPDGEHIAYYSNRAGGWDVFVMDLTGSGDTNLTLSQATEQTPAWQPWSTVR
jgi:hypothetical protein